MKNLLLLIALLFFASGLAGCVDSKPVLSGDYKIVRATELSDSRVRTSGRYEYLIRNVKRQSVTYQYISDKCYVIGETIKL